MQQTRHRLAVLVISLATTVLFTLLFVRLVDVQLFQGRAYLQQADQNRFFDLYIPAPRGLLLDRYGEPLVWNVQQYFKINDPEALFSEKVPISREEALQLIASQGAQTVATELQRLYRYPGSLAHVLGYVGEVTAEDLQKNNGLQPGMVIGKAGLELSFQDQMRGREGVATYEINALGHKQRLVHKQEPTTGESIQTTLDPYLTELAARKLGEKKGVVIMTDIETGKVIVLASTPTFNPNLFSQKAANTELELQRKKEIQAVFQDPRNLFFNRAVAGAYPPGSVFKLVTATAGLKHGKLNDETEVVDEGVLRVGEFQFGNWYYRQYGRVEGAVRLTRAISRSNDIYFYKAAEWVGPTALAEMARVFGYGEKTGIELPTEARGLVPDPVWKEKIRGEQWYLGNTYHFGIGQGDLLTTPIQIAQMTQAIANNGKLCPPSLIDSQTLNCRQLDVEAEYLHKVVEGMIEACSNGGTAYPFFPFNTARRDFAQDLQANLEHGVAACKTGTAEFGAANEEGHRKTHALFTVFLTLPQQFTEGSQSIPSPTTQFAPTFDQVAAVSDEQLKLLWQEQVKKHGFPRRIGITVIVESDEQVPFREGSRDAAPIAEQMMSWMVE